MAASNKIQVGYIEPQDGVQFKVDEGTAAAPGICFVDSAATGLYSPGTGQIAWSTSGKQTALRILADGKVGIDCSPTVALEVNGTIKASAIDAPIEGTLDDWIVHAGDTDTKIGFSAADTFEIHAGGGPRVVVTTTETTSNSPVTIKKTGTNAKITLSRNESVTSNDAPVAVIDFANNTANTVNSRIFAKTAGTSNVGGDLSVETRADGGSLTEKFRITGTGQLRIQTTYDGASTQSNDFPVLNINNLQGSYTADRILGGVTFGKSPGHTNGIRAGMMAHYASTGNSSGNVGTYLSFRTSANATGDSTEKLRITSGGKVGINTTTPTDLLTIVHSANTDDGISIVNTNNSQASAIAQLELSAGDNSHARVQFECNGKYSTIRHDGNGHLDFYTNGSNKRLAIMSSGHVNIGTGNLTQTDRMLNVYGGRIRIEGIPDNSNSFEVYASSTTGQSHGILIDAGTNSSDINANFRQKGGANLLRIRGDGVVLIGSSTTQQGSTSKLEVMGTLNNSYPGYSYPIMVSDNAAYNSSGGPGGGIGFSFKQNNGGAYAQAGGIRGIKENTTDGNYASALTFYTRPNGGGTEEQVRITSGGCLAIGTASPGQGSVAGIHIKSTANDDCRIAFETPNKASSRIGYYGLSNRFGMDVYNGFEIRDVAASYATRLQINSSGETFFNHPVNITAGSDQGSGDATLKVTATTNNDWAIYVNKWGGSANEYGINVDIGKNAAYAYRIRGDGSQTWTVDGAGAISHNMWADAPSGFASGGLTYSTQAVAEYHYTWAQSGQEDYYIDLTCGSYFHAEFIYTSDQSNGGHHMEQYARGKWANNHITHTGFLYEYSGKGGPDSSDSSLTTTITVSDQSGNGSVDLKSGLTAAGAAGATYRGMYGGGFENTSSNNNGRLRFAEDKTNASGSVGNRSLIVKVYYGSFSISKSVQ